MRFLYANEFLTDGYTITENSEDASYPVENAQDPQLSRKYWTTGDSAEWVKVDGGASEAITANCAFIAGHNLTSGGTYAIEGNDTDVWTSPTVDEAFSHDSGVMFKAFTSDDLRYWRWNLADGSNPDTVLKVGALGLGTYFDLSVYAQTAFSRDIIDTSRVKRSPTGQVFGLEGVTYLEYTFQFSDLSDADRQNLEAMWKANKKVKPIVFIPNPSDSTLAPFYGHITAYKMTHVIGLAVWGANLTLTEGL